MKTYTETQKVKQLEKRKGGYFYFMIPATTVNEYENKRMTRFICTLEEKLEFQCGLNHLGDGNFFIIISSKNLASINKGLGNEVSFELREDPNPLGVEMPEVLQVLLDQDPELNTKFEKLTNGKKRHIIYSINKLKNIDRQVQKAVEMIENIK